ncbi:MAG: hypothetical protein EXR79_11185 [Myxococcales bacterium]|nr:hypothetical protein [Myxococcales bacterium]
MRIARCSRFIVATSFAVFALLGAVACAEDPVKANTSTGGEDAGEDPDSGPRGDATARAETSGDGGSPRTGDVKADAATGDGTAAPADGVVDTDGTAGPDAVTPGADVSGTVDGGVTVDATADVAPLSTLELPACAGPKTLSDKQRCANCKSKCTEFAVCGVSPTGKMTQYANDCVAVCEGGKSLLPKACPSCAECKPTDVPDPLGFCATLATGVEVTVKMECEIKCVDAKKTADGKPVYYKGPCKQSCSKPTTQGGGGCNLLKLQPVCAAGQKTYTNDCAMQNCEKPGCFPVGDQVKSDACAPAKMIKECDGACFDVAKTPICKPDCDPVCGILKSGKGQSFRNACTAGAAEATVGVCDGISATKNDVCSSSLYKAKGCCPDVDYSVVNQVCASKSDGKGGSQWVTFRNNDEYKCLTAGVTGWVTEYKGPCLCSCTNTEKFVCGDDGQTYVNKCQAECYNPNGKFGWKDGPC